MPAGFNLHPPRAQREVDLRVVAQKGIADIQNTGPGRGDMQIVEQDRGNSLVHQDTAMLGIVAELDHIPVVVVGFEQVRLRSAAHFADVPDCGKRHQCSNLELYHTEENNHDG